MNQQIQSLQHPLVKHLVKLRKERAYRYENRSLIVEGIKPVLELAKTMQPKVLLSTKPHSNALIVSEEIMQKVSGMENPEGLLGEFPMPGFSSLQKLKYIVALDGINDPGNLGTILRTALAIGWEGAFITENSCDPFNDKAIRAARGATFRLPIRIGKWKELIEIAQQNQMPLYAADLEGKKPEEIGASKAKILVLGNEAHGPSPEILEHCEKVTIPMPGEMESLNVAVAGGILLYLLRTDR
jgi:RNA methyltransferase, TrmH family